MSPSHAFRVPINYTIPFNKVLAILDVDLHKSRWFRFMTIRRIFGYFDKWGFYHSLTQLQCSEGDLGSFSLKRRSNLIPLLRSQHFLFSTYIFCCLQTACLTHQIQKRRCYCVARRKRKVVSRATQMKLLCPCFIRDKIPNTCFVRRSSAFVKYAAVGFYN